MLLFVIYWLFSKFSISKKSFRNTISVKQFGSRSRLMLCWSWSGSKLFVKVISSRGQKSSLARKELKKGINEWCWTLPLLLLLMVSSMIDRSYQKSIGSSKDNNKIMMNESAFVISGYWYRKDDRPLSTHSLMLLSWCYWHRNMVDHSQLTHWCYTLWRWR